MPELVYIIQTPPFWLKTPPLSLTYLKTYLESKGIAVKILDLNMSLFRKASLSLKSWLALNGKFEEGLFSFTEKQYPGLLAGVYQKIKNTSLVGFSLLKRNNPFAFSLAQRIKKRFPGKKIIFGGPEVFFLEKRGRLDREHYWVIGEGEIPLHRVIAGEKNKVFKFRELPDLDCLPFYDFEDLTLNSNGPGRPSPYIKTLPLLSSRGCPHGCAFCSERRLYQKFRHHSPEYMLDQIDYLKSKHKTNTFVFLDSLINYQRSWLESFCSGLAKRKLNIKWEAQMRIENNFPPELARLMQKSGCYNLFIGLESGSDAVLDNMRKGFTARTAERFLKTLYRQGLHFEISLIFGYPRETEKEFRETINFIRKNKKNIPKIAQVNPFTDYLNRFSHQSPFKDEPKEKVKVFLKVLEDENIRYTKSFINNLIYEN